jgi:hypothetical protein
MILKAHRYNACPLRRKLVQIHAEDILSTKKRIESIRVLFRAKHVCSLCIKGFITCGKKEGRECDPLASVRYGLMMCAAALSR